MPRSESNKRSHESASASSSQLSSSSQDSDVSHQTKRVRMDTSSSTTTVRSIKDQIINAASQEELTITYNGQVSSLELDETLAAISTLQPRRIPKIVFNTPGAFTPLKAMYVLNRFLTIDGRRELVFRIYSNVDSPGQRPLMELLADYPEQTEGYESLYQDFASFRLFMYANHKRKMQQTSMLPDDTPRENLSLLPTLPVECIDRIQDYTLPTKIQIFRLE